MTLRDSHNRCVTCGRPPGEECCGTCHAVAQMFEEQRLQAMRDRGLATWRQNLHPELVNTEAVNQ